MPPPLPFQEEGWGPWNMIPTQLESPVQFSGSSRNKPFGASAVLVGYINGRINLRCLRHRGCMPLVPHCMILVMPPPSLTSLERAYQGWHWVGGGGGGGGGLKNIFPHSQGLASCELQILMEVLKAERVLIHGLRCTFTTFANTQIALACGY